MKKAEIKARALEFLSNHKDEYAGFKYGTVKKVIIENNGDEGYIAIFYKNCIAFENYKEKYDTRPVEIFSYSIDIEEVEIEDEKYESIFEEIVHFHLDLHFDCDSKDDEWKDKKQERMSDRDFFDSWV